MADWRSDLVLESRVETYFVRQVALYLLGEAKKFIGHRGWPDRIVVLPCGILDWVELKRPKGGRFEPLQLRVHDRLRRQGHGVFVILNRAQVDEYIADARRRIMQAAKLQNIPIPLLPIKRPANVGIDKPVGSKKRFAL